MQRRRLLGGALLALTGPAAWAVPRAAQSRIRVGVEASLQASGLADRLGEAIGRDVGLAIAWEVGPGGTLLPQLERGELDAALTQSPALELALQQQGLIHDRRPVAQTELVLVGPAPRKATKRSPAQGDPAGIAGGRDAVAALTQVVAAAERGEAQWVATGEPSGSRSLEQAIWKAAGPLPIGPWLRTAGAGPLATLQLAHQTGSYALVERGVWATHGRPELAVLVEGDPRLALTYHVMLALRSQHPAGKLLVNWLTGPAGQRIVAGYGRGYRRAG